VARLFWSLLAPASLRAQDDYLRPRNSAAADAVITEIETLAELIAHFPEMGRRIGGTALRYHVTRRYRYRVIYRVEHDAIYVMDVLHPRQE
jgi:plasmid stabilization system protein ParE